MKNIDFELGRLAGILDIFALLNTKTNHDDSFQIMNLNTADQSQDGSISLHLGVSD